MLGAKENFVVLSVNGMYKSDVNADAMADLIDYMVQNYAIDATRVYATGFQGRLGVDEHRVEARGKAGRHRPV